MKRRNESWPTWANNFNSKLRSAMAPVLAVSLACLVSSALSQALTVNTEMMSSPIVLEASQGVTSMGAPPYYMLSGFNGLELPISKPDKNEFDYTIMFWFRSHLSIQDLIHDSYNKHYLFEMEGSVSCYLSEGTKLKCSTTSVDENGAPQPYEIQLAVLPDIQQWIHLTYTAHAKEKYSTLRIDFPSQFKEVRGGYAGLSGDNAYLGINQAKTRGFKGDVREFFVSYGAIESEKVPNLMNAVKVFDVSTMAYYRFVPDLGILADQMRSQAGKEIVASIQDDSEAKDDETAFEEAKLYVKPVHKYEDATNPFCDTLESQFMLLPRFENFVSGEIPIENYKKNQKVFGYTLSMWIRNEGGHKFTNNPRFGVEKHTFFKLDDSFALWFDSPYSFRVYVYSKSNVDEETSSSCFLPLHQWVNIQISINSGKGITVMTFNTNGERQQLVTKEVYLAPQIPRPELVLFENFIGNALELQLWYDGEIQIPYQTAVIEEIEEYKDGLLQAASLYYNFEFSNHNGEGFQPMNVEENDRGDPGTQRVLLARVNNQMMFEELLSPRPENINFAEPSSLGQLHAETKLWDGMSCPDTVNNQLAFNGMGANISLNVMFPITNQFTVEFWFRIPEEATFNSEKANILFTLATTVEEGEQAQEAMTIFIDKDGLLKCAPFGVDSSPNAILTYTGFRPYDKAIWHHVSCSYDRDKSVLGQVLAVNLSKIKGASIASGVHDGLLPKTFSRSIADQNQRIVNYIQPTEMTVVLGNSAKLDGYQMAYFKDLRVWSSKRSPFDLFEHRFRQVAVTEDLIVNFKLMDGNPFVRNFADLDRISDPVEGFKVQYFPSDGENIICAVDRYFVATIGQCITIPFTPEIPITYSVVNSEQHGHSMVLTADYAYSPLTLPGTYQPKFKNFWVALDKETDKLYVEQRRNARSIVFDPNYMEDGQEYKFRLTATDQNGHNYWQTIVQSFYPRKCFYVADVETNEPFKEVIFRRRLEAEKQEEAPAVVPVDGEAEQTAPKQNGVSFSFDVRQVDGCDEDYFDLLQEDITIQTMPKVSQSILNKAITGFDSNSRKFEITFEEEVLDSKEFPLNTPINMIFNVYWKKAGSLAVSHMSVVYRLTVVEPIVAKVQASTKLVDVDQSIVFDASESQFTQSGLTTGLVYRWVCPGDFQSYCDDWFNSPILEITPEAFKTFKGKISTAYIFKIEVWSLMVGLEPKPEQIFRAQTTATWKSLQAPEFDIIVASSPDLAQPRLFVTKQNEVQIKLKNYRNTDAFLKYFWTLTPEESFDQSLIRQSADQSILTIDANALQFSTSYSLEVVIKNDQPGGLTSTQVLDFSTGEAPQGTGFSVSPQEGSMFETEFTIELGGWTSSNLPIMFTLWGITSTDPLSRITLTSQPQQMESGSASFKTSLPLIYGVQAEVTDAYGEVVIVNVDVRVSQSSETDWTQVVKNVQDLEGDSRTRQQYNAFIAFQANNEAQQGKLSVEQAQEVNQQLVQILEEDLQAMDATEPNAETRSNVSLMGATLAQLTATNSTLNIEIVEDSATLLEDMMAKRLTFVDTVQNNKDFNENYAAAIGNLISYATITANDFIPPVTQSKQSDGRRLQGAPADEEPAVALENKDDPADLQQLRSQIHRLIVQKNRFLDILCETLTFDGQENRYTTPKLELVTNLIKIDSGNSIRDSQFVYSGDQSMVVMPTDELIQQTQDLSPSSSQICIQVTFMNSNPLAGYEFQAQYPGGEVFMQVSTLDDKGVRILSSESGITGLDLKPFEIRFSYDFPEDEEFARNQTVCMGFDGNLEVLAESRWTQRTCITEIFDEVEDGEQTTLVCRCSSMSNHYFGLITDVARDIEVIVPHTYEYHLMLLWVIIPYFLLGCCGPCLMIRFDHNDYKRVEDDIHSAKLTDDFVKEFQHVRDIECREEVFYKQSLLVQYMELNQNDARSGSRKITEVYWKQLHPFWNLYFKFDFGQKRLFRLTLLICQVSLVTFFGVLGFLKKYEDWQVYSHFGDLKIYALGLLLGLLTLPAVDWSTRIVRTNVKMPKKIVQEEADKANDADDVQQIQETEDGNGDSESQAVLDDPWMYFKMIFLFSTVFIYLCTLVLLSLLLTFAQTGVGKIETESDISYLEVLLMDDTHALDFVKTWYLALVAFGWTIYNGIRILVIANLAPVEGKEKWDKKYQEQENKQKTSPNCGLCCCIISIIKWVWCLISWLPYQLWRLFKYCVGCFHNRCSCCCDCSVLLYCFEYSWRSAIFVPRESIEISQDILAVISIRENNSGHHDHPFDQAMDEEAHGAEDYAPDISIERDQNVKERENIRSGLYDGQNDYRANTSNNQYVQQQPLPQNKPEQPVEENSPKHSKSHKKSKKRDKHHKHHKKDKKSKRDKD